MTDASRDTGSTMHDPARASRRSRRGGAYETTSADARQARSHPHACRRATRARFQSSAPRRLDIGGFAGLVAPLVGKQPPDSHVWIIEGGGPGLRPVTGADVHGRAAVADRAGEPCLAAWAMRRTAVVIEDARHKERYVSAHSRRDWTTRVRGRGKVVRASSGPFMRRNHRVGARFLVIV